MKNILLAFAVTFLACNQTPVETPVRSFDRPSDASLSCVIYHEYYPTVSATSSNVDTSDPAGVYQPLNMTDCALLLQAQQKTAPDLQDVSVPFTPELRAVVTDSARGQLALVGLPEASLLDLDLRNPGYNFVPVGRTPSGVRSTQDGCMAATANTDSCDITLIDLPILYNMASEEVRKIGSTSFGENVTKNVQLWAGTGTSAHRLYARPTAIEITNWLDPAVSSTDASTRHSCTNVTPQFLSADGGVPVDMGPVVSSGGPPFVETSGNVDYHAWLALPGCQAVVETTLSLGATPIPVSPGSADTYVKAQITHALHVDPTGVTSIDPDTLSCPVECTADTTTNVTPTTDPNVPGGQLPPTTAAPVTITYDTDSQTQRLAIGDYYNERVSWITLDPVSGDPGPAQSVVLETGAIGVSRVRISPRGPAGKFLYAIARDGSARVVDLDQIVECETNPDPTLFQGLAPIDPMGRNIANPEAAQQTTDQGQVRAYGCLPLGALTTPRRAGYAIGPGIQLDGGANARDVAFVHLDGPANSSLLAATNGTPESASPGLLVGDYAWLFGSDGRATVINIYDACPAPNDPQQISTCTNASCYSNACEFDNAQPSRLTDYQNNFGSPYPTEFERLSHHVRNGAERFVQPADIQDQQGTPRVQDTTVPLTITVQGEPATEGNGFRLATLESVDTTIPSLAVPDTQYISFMLAPDPEQVRNETWTLSWEGPLPGSQRTEGRMCGAGDANCPRNSFVDAGAAVCAHDALPGDKLEITGCDHDSDCLYTQKCMKDPGAPAIVTTGLCLTRDTDDQPHIQDTQQQDCRTLLDAQRYYRMGSPKQAAPLPNGEVTDIMDLSEIYEPEYEPQTRTCTPVTDDCSDVTVQPSIASDSTTVLTTTCLLDWDGEHRCLRPCSLTGATAEETGCGDGYVCYNANIIDPDHPEVTQRCMRSPLDLALLAECMTYPLHYQLRAGNAFTVIGGTSGFQFDVSPNPVTLVCEQTPGDLERIRLRNPRIPLVDPTTLQCPEQISAATGVNALTFQGPGAPNACYMNQENGDLLVHFENAIFSFALRLPNNPTGYVPADQTLITFGVVGGGFSLGTLLQVGSSNTPAQSIISSVVAPDNQTVYVVDQGKSSQPTGLRGQLFRLVSFAQQADPDFSVR